MPLANCETFCLSLHRDRHCMDDLLPWCSYPQHPLTTTTVRLGHQFSKMIPFDMGLCLCILLEGSSLLSLNLGSSHFGCFKAYCEYHSPVTSLSFYLNSVYFQTF